MNNTEHYALNIAEGGDYVNLMTYSNPNFNTIDGAMFSNKMASIQSANETFTDGSHNIIRSVSGSPWFSFVALADFNSGDTFTVDGQTVSAVQPSGAGLTTGAFRINSKVLCNLDGNRLTVYTYSGTGIAEDAAMLGGKLPAYYAPASTAFATFAGVKSGTTFTLTGAPDVVNIMFTAPARFNAGDAFNINGQNLTARTLDGKPLADGAFVQGAVVTATIGGNYLNFKGGGGIAESVLATATATESDVLSGKTFFAGSALIKTGTATLPNVAQLIESRFNLADSYNTSTVAGNKTFTTVAGHTYLAIGSTYASTFAQTMVGHLISDTNTNGFELISYSHFGSNSDATKPASHWNQLAIVRATGANGVIYGVATGVRLIDISN